VQAWVDTFGRFYLHNDTPTGAPVGGMAIGGRGAMVRVVTIDGAVFDIDFAAAPQARQVSGLSIPGCRALARFPTGWVFGTGILNESDTVVEVVNDDNTRRSFSITAAGRPSLRLRRLRTGVRGGPSFR